MTEEIKETLKETKPLRHPQFKDKELMVSPFDGVESLFGVFNHSVQKNGQNPCMGARKLIKIHKTEVIQGGKTKVWETPELSAPVYKNYKEVAQISIQFGDGVLNMTGAKFGDNFGLYEETRMEWMQALLVFYYF